MPSAKLTISIDGAADALRAFGKISGASKAANAALSADARRAKTEITKLHEEEVKEALKSADAQVQSDMKVFDTKLKLAKQAGDRVAREIAAGVTTEENAAKRKEQIYRTLAVRYLNEEEKKTKALETEEKKRTAVTERESRKRERVAAGGGGSGRGYGGYAARAAAAVASGLNDIASRGASAEEQYAPTERRLNEALYQSTGSNAEIAYRKNQILKWATDHNADFGETAEAAAQAQGRFSVFGDRSMTSQQRDARMQGFLGNLSEAQSLGQSPVQFAQLAGALSQGGLSGDAQKAAMRTIAGITMRGGVEAGDLIGKGLRPLMAAVARAQSGGPEAITRAVMEEVSALEVLSPRGVPVTSGGNSINAIQQNLGAQRTQSALLAHVRNQFGAGSALESQLFENGSLRENMRNPFAFGETISNAFGGDRDKVANFLATGQRKDGHVLRQVLTEPQRKSLAALTQTGEGGVTGYEQIRQIQAGAAIGQGDINQGAILFQNDSQARVTNARNRELLALLSPEINSAAQQQREFSTEHPYIARAAGMLPFGLGDMMIAGATWGANSISDPQRNDAQQLPGRSLPVNIEKPIQIDQRSVQAFATAVAREMPNVEPHDLVHRQTVDASGPNGSQRHP